MNNRTPLLIWCIASFCYGGTNCPALRGHDITFDEACEIKNSELIYVKALYHVCLPDNTLSNVMAEVTAPGFLPLLASSFGLDVALSQRTNVLRIRGTENELACIGTSDVNYAFMTNIAEKIEAYSEGRLAGLSRKYLLRRLVPNEKPCADKIARALCADLASTLPVRVSDLTPQETCVLTNDTGQVFRHVSYAMSENGLSWIFHANISEDGNYEGNFFFRHDEKGEDPKYRSLFRQIDNQIDAEMRLEGMTNGFGRCHHYWARKKELLKERGIIWYSPKELNPDTRFD